MRQLEYTILILVSLFCTIIIACPASAAGIIAVGGCGITVSALFLHYRAFLFKRRNYGREGIRISLLLFRAVVTCGFLAHFIYVWMPSSKLKAIESALHLPRNAFVYTVGTVAAIGTVVFFHELLSLFLNPQLDAGLSYFLSGYRGTEPSKPAEIKESWKEKGFIPICAVAAVTLCSCSSPLYPMNSWADVNAYFTVGKGMFRGLVPYRDLFEHKGPFLFFLYGLASLVSPDSLRGGYLIEIIAAYIYLHYSYRIACFHLNKKSIFLVPLIAVISFCSKAFDQGGCPEEICLAFIAYSLWLFLRNYLYNDLRPLHFLFLGIIAGCIFWTKFTLIGIYIGWYIWMFLTMTRDGKGKALTFRTAMLSCGVVLATVPWVIYFGVHGAITDWLEVYIYDNMFIYTTLPSYTSAIAKLPVIGGLSTGLESAFRKNPVTIVLSVLFTAIMLRIRNNRMADLYAYTILGMFTAVFIGGRTYRYYSLPMNVLLAPALALGFSGTSGKRLELFRKRAPIFAILCILCIYLLTPNRSYMSCRKEDLAQYRFRRIITENHTETTILNYGSLDGGFYTICDILPSCRAFYVANVLTEELMEEQNTYVNSGLCDYIITTHGNNNDPMPNANNDEDDGIHIASGPEQSFRLYDLVAECTCPANGTKRTFRLYRIKTLATSSGAGNDRSA